MSAVATVEHRWDADTVLVRFDPVPEAPPAPMPKPKPIRIWPGEYMGVQGFNVAQGLSTFDFHVFVETREAAEMCRAARQCGEDITLDHMLGIEPPWWDTEA